MENQKKVFEQMDLKYCERCGGLWLRRRGDVSVYCAACVPKVAALPVWREKRGHKRAGAVNPAIKVEGYGLELLGMVAEGGEA